VCVCLDHGASPADHYSGQELANTTLFSHQEWRCSGMCGWREVGVANTGSVCPAGRNWLAKCKCQEEDQM